jgi:Flp pilus assembly protein TadB
VGISAVCIAGKISFALIVPAFWLVELQKLKQTSRSRAEAFEKDYTALLLSLASSVRTGRDPLQALVESAKLFPTESVIAGELGGVRQALESGRTEKAAILGFAETINHPDVPLFRSAFVLARKEGSALGECLHRLTRVTRNRQSFRRRSRSAVAMQKMSAYGIALCTVIVCLFQIITNAEGLMKAIEHPVGSMLLCLGGGLILVGLVWMNHSTKARV